MFLNGPIPGPQQNAQLRETPGIQSSDEFGGNFQGFRVPILTTLIGQISITVETMEYELFRNFKISIFALNEGTFLPPC